MNLLATVVIFLPFVTNPEPPPFNVNMVDLYFDTGLPVSDYGVWEHLDPSPHVADLTDITYTPPAGYVLHEMWFYSYTDSMYHSLRVSRPNVTGCMPAFTFYDGGPNELIGGEWCLTMVNTNLNVFGSEQYIFTSTSAFPVDVIMFKVREDPLYCSTCVPGTPPVSP